MAQLQNRTLLFDDLVLRLRELELFDDLDSHGSLRLLLDSLVHYGKVACTDLLLQLIEIVDGIAKLVGCSTCESA